MAENGMAITYWKIYSFVLFNVSDHADHTLDIFVILCFTGTHKYTCIICHQMLMQYTTDNWFFYASKSGKLSSTGVAEMCLNGQ